MWDLTGRVVAGTYMGHHVTGLVESSRAKNGGQVQHTVLLNVPVKLARNSQPVGRVVLNNSELIPGI